MAIKPMLGDWEIPRIEAIRTLEKRQFAEHNIPGRHGAVFHDLGTNAAVIEIEGSVYAEQERSEFLTTIRDHFTAGEPLTFVADIVEATQVQYVLVEELAFEEHGSHPDETRFHMQLRESPPPPPPPGLLGGLDGIDTGLLDVADGFIDSIGSVLDTLDALGSIPDLSNPIEPVVATVNQVNAALAGLADVGGLITDLFGDGS